MKQEINSTKFDKNDPNFIEFFEEHGWVVLNGNLSSESIEGLNQWANLKKRYADEMGLSLVEYENEVSQWRNLWHTEKGYFRDLIFKPVLHECAWKSMNWERRLLHDHIICKPHKGHNDKIPWHQDSMFWPVNSPAFQLGLLSLMLRSKTGVWKWLTAVILVAALHLLILWQKKKMSFQRIQFSFLTCFCW